MFQNVNNCNNEHNVDCSAALQCAKKNSQCLKNLINKYLFKTLHVSLKLI